MGLLQPQKGGFLEGPFKELLDPGNTSKDVWADAAYRSASHLEYLRQEGYREHIQRKGTSGHPLTRWEKQGNRTRSRTRSRVEHIFFEAQKQQAASCYGASAWPEGRPASAFATWSTTSSASPTW